DFLFMICSFSNSPARVPIQQYHKKASTLMSRVLILEIVYSRRLQLLLPGFYLLLFSLLVFPVSVKFLSSSRMKRSAKLCEHHHQATHKLSKTFAGRIPAAATLHPLSLHSHHGVAEDFVAEGIAGLEFFADDFAVAVAFFHADSLVQARVERLANGFDASHAELLKRFLELLNYGLDAFDVIVVLHILGHVLEGALEVVDDRQEVA